MSGRPSRRLLVALLAAGVVGSLSVVTIPAAADHTDPPERVTLMGSLMSELGCDADWSETCTATDLAVTGDGLIWEFVAELPAGSYEFKVRLNGSWDENYGAAGAANGANIPLVLEGAVALRFVYDHTTHVITLTPVAQQPPASDADRDLAATSLREDLTRERFYFVMADRFANGDSSNDTARIAGDRLAHGYDPTATGFYHGGDLAGLLDQLDYIEGLGTTAIWLTPSFKNKPVQGAPGSESAGYHGYWITDFTQIDPHLGTNAELQQLVDAAHARGIKVFFDIITNHTADVIAYDETLYNAEGNLPYVDKATEPYVTAAGVPFDDRDYADGDPAFPAVNLDSFPYTPLIPAGDEDAKVPDWLNDPTMYHNRGTSSFAGENSEYGDFPSGPFSALDDLWTERPEVVDGMVDIYQTWVRDAGVDGFRIDTVKHVNMEFWQQFSPALTGYAASIGNEDFFMFGEIFDADPRFMSRYTTEGKLQAAVDFGFQSNGANFANGDPTAQLRDFFAKDDYYTDNDSNAYSLPTFLGNHDMGRIGSFIRQRNADAADAELLKRDQLGHSLMYLTRGQPVVYYGDEQGFAAELGEPSGVGDQRAREDMFPSQVAEYNDNDLIGTDSTTAVANYEPGHPLYQHIAALSELRDAHPALADGAQIHRYASGAAGVYAFSRIDAEDQVEYLVAANNAETAKTVVLLDVQRPHGVQGRVAGGHAADQDRPGGPGLRHGAAAVDRRVESCGAAQADRADAGAVLPHARGRCAGQWPGRGRRLGARERLLPGDLRLAARRYAGMEGSRHRRQRAIPRLPRRVRHRRGHTGRIPRHRGRARRRSRRGSDLGRRRRACPGDRWGRRRWRAGRAACRGLCARQPQQRDRLPGGLDAGL